MFESAFFLVLFVICGLSSSAKTSANDPTKWDYCQYSKGCKVTFRVDGEPTGCPLKTCNQRGTRSEIAPEKFMEFRKAVVEAHNYWRNYYASGQEKEGFSQPVANMVVMNYDLELEHLARCWGRGFFNGYHDPCRWYHDGRPVGQNLWGISVQITDMVPIVKRGVKDWYEEVKDMKPEAYEQYTTSKHDPPIGHFTQVVWGGAARVGCAGIYTSDVNKEKFIKKVYVSSLICDYYVPEGLGPHSNMQEAKIFQQGPPCSQCPSVNKYSTCNSNYTSLCGELEPIPSDKPYVYADNSSPAILYGRNIFLIFASTILMLL
ncbi:scoloptoxin SSD552 [Tribolium castaneum]|uniref:CRISP/Allergen/PR-1-like Protein n=1 Tax=Tribolium castaneum TaxID=7070 RepID=A0A139WGX7_TRICA|nr:PREDICTED: venom allergen 5-like [Tribolium castaneum]KYB27248.1 CRISP/Allergen/PR-1-like Protein [Tribolium castaneum]|eukprot:XP_008193874.1 PREDICTED: venom allergen 5-like [Tribolium castaneum]